MPNSKKNQFNYPFEIEHPDNNNFQAGKLLVFHVTLTERERYRYFWFYKKPAKNIFPHFKSVISRECKVNSAVRNEVQWRNERIQERYSTEEDRTRHTNIFFCQLQARGYGKNIKTKAKQQKKTRNDSSHCEKFCYFEFPFVCDAICMCYVQCYI